jgi:hypothetical protein
MFYIMYSKECLHTCMYLGVKMWAGSRTGTMGNQPIYQPSGAGLHIDVTTTTTAMVQPQGFGEGGSVWRIRSESAGSLLST